MSKMPAKKKSCFQITSVTQAQVAASSIADDTESLDDPDESRTEDVSSEIFDMPRTDFEPEVCDRSSSEETLNNVEETEAPGTMALHLAQETQPLAVSSPPNGGVALRSTGTGHINPHVANGSVPTGQTSAATGPTQQPTAAPHSAATTSCSSRFRVIKLDHGTGEPFRRGRWTCMDFYDRDSESSVISRTDSIKHGATLDQGMERDSGLGVTGSSALSMTPESTADSGYSAAPYAPPAEPQGYGLPLQDGSATSAFQPAGALQLAQTLLPAGLNGVAQGGMPQKSPGVVPATQVQPFGNAAQHPAHAVPSGLPGAQLDLRQQQANCGAQTLPVASQGPSPVITPATSVPPVMGSLGHGVELAGSGVGLLLQSASVAAGAPLTTGGGLQLLPPGVVGSSPVAGVQNAPATTAMPGLTNAVGVPNSGPAHSGPLQTQAPLGAFTTSATQEPPAPFGQLLPGAAGDNHQRNWLPQSSVGKDVVNSLFGIAIAMDGEEDSSTGASVVAIDNKIEQAMDLVKSHLMYAVREEVEVLKEQIKELYEKNSVLERENAVLRSLANSDQLTQLSTQLASPGSTSPLQPAVAALQDGLPQQPNVTSA